MKKIFYKIKSSLMTFGWMILIAFLPGVIHAQSVSKAEYFFDVDEGFGKNNMTSLVLSADSTWQLPALNATGLSLGYHHFYLRTLSSDGYWSQTIGMTVEVISNLTASKLNIVSGEYFIDVDPQFGKGKKITVTADSSITKSFTIPKTAFNGKALGYHSLYYRMKDKNGTWSQTINTRIELIKNDALDTIVKVEYFFSDSADLGFGKCHSQIINISPNSSTNTATFYIPYSQIPFVNNDTLFVRVNESITKRWSQTAAKKGLHLTHSPRIADNGDNSSINIYPVPASNHLTIDLEKLPDVPLQFTLYNITGETILQQWLTDQSSEIKLTQPDGIYFINIGSEEKTITRKIIIQN